MTTIRPAVAPDPAIQRLLDKEEIRDLLCL